MSLKRILVVDDEKNVTIFLSELLKQWGYDPIVASDGEKALELLSQENFNLILLDVMMPCIDGLAVMNEIHRNKYKEPVIIISSVTDLSIAEKIMELGAKCYIPKPFDLEKFKTKIEKYIL